MQLACRKTRDMPKEMSGRKTPMYMPSLNRKRCVPQTRVAFCWHRNCTQDLGTLWAQSSLDVCNGCMQWMYASQACISEARFLLKYRNHSLYIMNRSVPSQLNSGLHLQSVWLLRGWVSYVGVISDACSSKLLISTFHTEECTTCPDNPLQHLQQPCYNKMFSDI